MHYRCRNTGSRCGCNEGDRAVLDALQQALLLLFVQVLDLVQIQQDAARPRQRADVLEHRLDVAGAAGSAVELVQSHAAVLCDDAGHCGLAGTGRAVEDHVGDAAALNGTAKHPARGQQMLLPAHICQHIILRTVGSGKHNSLIGAGLLDISD